MQSLLRLQLDKVFHFAKLNRDLRRYMAFSKKQSGYRIMKATDIVTKDVFSFLMDAKDPETGGRLNPNPGGKAFKADSLIFGQISPRGFRNARTHRRSQPADHRRYVLSRNGSLPNSLSQTVSRESSQRTVEQAQTTPPQP